MNLRIVSDSSCDMNTNEYENLFIVPLTISTENQKWIDDENVNIDSMLSTLEKYKGRSYTSCPDINSWITAFGDSDIIFVITMTSGLSGTYNSATAAAKLYLESHPNAKIKVFDTLSTCSQQRLLVDYIHKLTNENLEFEEICIQAEKYLKKTKMVFMIKSLHNFAQNGRVNKAIAATIGFLGINIIATPSEKGTFKALTKCRGVKKAIVELINQLKNMNYSGGKLYISHVDNITLAKEIKEDILKIYESANIKIRQAKALCSYYAERGAVLLGFETL